MLQITHIDSLDSKLLAPYRTLRRAVEHIREGIFVAEGEKVVRRLLNTDIQLVSTLITEDWLSEIKPLLEKKANGEVKVWVAPKRLLESIVGFHLHQGIMAVGRIPKPVGLGEIMRLPAKPHLLIALDGLSNADNVGVIVRNCVAFGANALIVPLNTSSPYLRRSVRMSMGAIFELPVVSVEKLEEALVYLKQSFQTRIIAAHPRDNVSSVYATDLRGNICLVLGSEGAGISPEILELSSERISIPITSKTDSLNVATASGILLFEAQRQRTRNL